MRKAIDHYEQALQIACDIHDRRAEWINLVNLGVTYAALGETQKAREHYEQSLQITCCEAFDMPQTNYSCAVKLGILCLEEGKPDEAQDYFARGIALCHALLEKTPRLYDALYHLALAQLGSEQTSESLATYRQALEVCAAKGVVQSALQDLRLLERAAQPVAGLAEVAALLERRIGRR
jgi:tetratricopeptide (TPR) repeat protein